MSRGQGESGRPSRLEMRHFCVGRRGEGDRIRFRRVFSVVPRTPWSVRKVSELPAGSSEDQLRAQVSMHELQVQVLFIYYLLFE